MNFESLEDRRLLAAQPWEILPSGDRIPNFVSTPDIVMETGNWNNISTIENDILIPAGVVVEITDALAAADEIRVEGTLRFNPLVNTKLLATTIFVAPEGLLEIKPSDDVSAEIVILDSPINVDLDPDKIGHGILVFGSIDVQGKEKAAFVRLADEVIVGASTLSLAEPAVGWESGDTILLPDTKQAVRRVDTPMRPTVGYEQVIIKNISLDNLVVELEAPVQFNHKGSRDALGNIHNLPHVANMTRNVVFSSENPDGTRGHLQAFGAANVDLAFASFEEFGRTTSSRLNNTTYDVDGNPVQFGTNQVGRYSIHMHHAGSPTEEEFRFNIKGNVVDGSPKWGIGIHNSHWGNISDNVVYNAVGAGIVTEHGNETGLVIDHNFVALSTGSGEPVDSDLRGKGQTDNGHEGSSYWFRGCDQCVISDNVAIGAQSAGFMLFQFTVQSTRTLKQDHPVSVSSSETYQLGLNEHKPALYSGNEVYASGNGHEIWDIHRDSTFILESPIAWNIDFFGIVPFYMNEIIINDASIVFDRVVSNQTSQRQYGFVPVGSTEMDLILNNAFISNAEFGVQFRNASYGEINGGLFGNKWDIVLTNNKYRSQTTKISNPSFQDHASNVANIHANFNLQPSFPSLTHADTNILEYDGKTYQLYYQQQAADFVIPAGLGGGIRESGITNQEHQTKYGTSIGGEIGSSNTTLPFVWEKTLIQDLDLPVEVNHAPILDPIADQFSNGEPITVELSASDVDGDLITFSVTAQGESELLRLDQLHGFETLGGHYFQGWIGLGEKWIVDANNELHYITPSGELYKWLGNPGQLGNLIGNIGVNAYSDPSLLWDAQPIQVTSTISGSTLTVDPGTGFFGVIAVSVTARDGEDEDEKSFLITVS